MSPCTRIRLSIVFAQDEIVCSNKSVTLFPFYIPCCSKFHDYLMFTHFENILASPLFPFTFHLTLIFNSSLTPLGLMRCCIAIHICIWKHMKNSLKTFHFYPFFDPGKASVYDTCHQIKHLNLILFLFFFFSCVVKIHIEIRNLKIHVHFFDSLSHSMCFAHDFSFVCLFFSAFSVVVWLGFAVLEKRTRLLNQRCMHSKRKLQKHYTLWI